MRTIRVELPYRGVQVAGPDLVVFDEETGEAIEGVREATVRLRQGEVAVVELEMYPSTVRLAGLVDRADVGRRQWLDSPATDEPMTAWWDRVRPRVATLLGRPAA